MNPGAFFDVVRKRWGALTGAQVDGFNAVLTACAGAPLAHAAYMLATAFHETNRTMQPVREAYWLSEAWRKSHLRYWPHYGRGYVQLTWPSNYQRADAELGLGQSLVTNPDRAMEPDIAARIMRKGMDEGWFTGKRMMDFLPASGPATPAQYINARRIINGTDRAGDIAAYADIFDDALQAAGWA